MLCQFLILWNDGLRRMLTVERLTVYIKQYFGHQKIWVTDREIRVTNIVWPKYLGNVTLILGVTHNLGNSSIITIVSFVSYLTTCVMISMIVNATMIKLCVTRKSPNVHWNSIGTFIVTHQWITGSSAWLSSFSCHCSSSVDGNHNHSELGPQLLWKLYIKFHFLPFTSAPSSPYKQSTSMKEIVKTEHDLLR